MIEITTEIPIAPNVQADTIRKIGEGIKALPRGAWLIDVDSDGKPIFEIQALCNTKEQVAEIDSIIVSLASQIGDPERIPFGVNVSPMDPTKNGLHYWIGKRKPTLQMEDYILGEEMTHLKAKRLKLWRLIDEGGEDDVVSTLGCNDLGDI